MGKRTKKPKGSQRPLAAEARAAGAEDGGQDETAATAVKVRAALPPEPVAFVDGAPTEPAPPPVLALSIGCWDGPELLLSDRSRSVPSTPPPLPPTPSLMPAVREATRARRAAFVAIMLVGVLIAGIALALSGGGEEAEPQIVALNISSRFGDLRLEGEGESAPSSSGLEEEPQDSSRLLAERSSSGSGAGKAPPGRGAQGSGAGQATVQQISGEVTSSSGAGRFVRGIADEVEELISSRRSERSGSGALTGEQVRRAVVANSSSVRSCHEREMARTGVPIVGRVVARIQIGSSGIVQGVRISSGPTTGTPLERCLELAIAQWRFPTARDQTVIEVPFNLSTRSAAGG